MPNRSPSARTRLLSTSEPRASRSPPHTSSTASSVQPPTKTERRRKSVLLVVVEELDAPADRVAQRSMPDGASRDPDVRSSRRCSSRASIAVGDSSLTRAAASSIASGRQSSRSQISAIASRSASSGSEVRAHGAGRSRNRRTASSRVSGARGNSCSPCDAQPHAARHGDLQARARGDDRRERRGRVDDLLEVVDDEQQPAALDVGDEALLEVALAVEEPERPRDRADHVAGIPDGLERHEDDAVRELVGRRRGDRLGEPGLADPAGAGDGEQADVVPAQQRGGFGDALVTPDQRRHRRGLSELPRSRARAGAPPSRVRRPGR